MASPAVALFVTCLLMRRMADITAQKLSSSSDFISLMVGQDVTLECSCADSVAVMFYWYKQTPGQKPKRVSKFYKHDKNGILMDEFQNNIRFELETNDGKNHLKISNVQSSDSGTYYCVRNNLFRIEFAEGTVVSVQGSGLNIPAQVHQSASESIQPGGSVTLDCTVHTGTCDGEHRVYWFKHSGQAHPGLIYTHGGSNDQCERKPETQTHSCVYNLPMNSLNVSDAGTYYCAVVSCGHVLFGNNTRLEQEEDSLFMVYFFSGALICTTILALLLAYAIYKLNRNTCQCTDCQVRASAASALNAEGNQDSDNLHYAALEHRVNRSTRHWDVAQSHCVYSSVRQ
ncbi:immunoglobulin kappa light chain-like isoform X2 [Mastacembelus armatus]|uniref:immunoglobulin kappa light chain-like isoform X2 n=1 Tax=Mastacembelus armatus TaxID=205130 RepID=UPI000E45EAF1|nr:immunoglobulin kappa light chain-like isoform X2 [Mastacembelus armatus]